jgi:hypothetical protein
MFNSPIFDVVIGLVLIFLLYSLLATTINEGIATILALRARMLRNAIRDHMLSNASNDSRWTSIWKGFREFFEETVILINGRKNPQKKKLGDHFFDHPLMKNYAATRIYPTPSYIPSENFSTIIADLLRKEFDQHVEAIVDEKLNNPGNVDSAASLREHLLLSSDLEKAIELVKYFGRHYAHNSSTPKNSLLEKDTWKIVQTYLKESGYNWERFMEKMETWFDDTMNRVSGWYKRQAQTILFFLGLLIAVVLNVDSIQIAHRLSRDNEARERMTQLAIQSLDTYKDDPRIKKNADTSNVTAAEVMAFNDYRRRLDSLVRKNQADLEKASNVLALGWEKSLSDDQHQLTFYDGAKKVLGFLLTTFAICLGAPFWFDLLNKLVKLRGTGKKEDSDVSELPGKAKAVAMAPVIIRNNNSSAEEAAG